jgi:hydroxymethylpyrimidine/phosphomethylpyrimidine kinase
LIDPAGIVALQERLLPLVDWITPNLEELAILTGRNGIRRKDLPAACSALQTGISKGSNVRQLGIIATGGHLDPPDDFLLTPGGEEVWLPGKRIITRSTHGTGCAFSSAFLCRLVLGDPAIEAAKAAKNYVVGALRSAKPRGAGNSPLNYLWTIHK